MKFHLKVKQVNLCEFIYLFKNIRKPSLLMCSGEDRNELIQIQFHVKFGGVPKKDSSGYVKQYSRDI